MQEVEETEVRTRKRRGPRRLFPPPSEMRCTAMVFLAARVLPEQCHFKRKLSTYCLRHWRERFVPGSV